MCMGRETNIFIKRAIVLGCVIAEAFPLLLSPSSQDVRLGQGAVEAKKYL